MERQNVLKLIEQEENLPVLPQLFFRIVEATSSPDMPVSELSNLILEDQVLTGRVLGIANSAHYGVPQKISTVTRAVMVLGFINLRNLITAITVVDTLNNDAFRGGLFETLWVHALACSLSASLLAQRLKVDHKEEAMVAGLMHDCGKLFLDHHFPEAYRRATEMTCQGKNVLAAEREVFGLTHVEVGEKIAHKWDLPMPVVEAIRDHHRFSKSPKNLCLSDIIYIANLFASHTIPQQWTDRIQKMHPENNKEEAINKICLELGLSEEAVQEVFQTTSQNIQRTAEGLNLKFLNPSIQKAADPSPELFRLQREMERKERQLAMVNEISALIMENPRPEELIQVVVEAVHHGIGFNRTLLFLLNPADNTVAGRVGLGYDVPPFLRKITLPIDSKGLMGKVIQEKKAFNILDSESRPYSDLPSLEVPSLAEIRAFALVPFVAETEVIGLVMVDNAISREAIRDQQVDLIRTFLTLAGVYLAKYKEKRI